MVESRGLPINPIYSTTVVSSLPWLFWKNNYRKHKYWINTITNNSLFYCVNKLRQQPKNCCFSHANWSTGLVSHDKLSGQITAEYTPIIFSLVHNYTKKIWQRTGLLQNCYRWLSQKNLYEKWIIMQCVSVQRINRLLVRAKERL